MENFKEEWGFPEGFKGIIEVSNTGRIINHNYRGRGLAKEIKPYLHHGYFYISINIQGKPRTIGVHRLVAMAFIPNPENLPFVNHKDENPQNNNVDNLEWCTHQYNITYGTAIQRRSMSQSIPVIQLSLNGEFINRFPSTLIASEATGITKAGISAACRGLQTQSHGYKWRYEDEGKHQQSLKKREQLVNEGIRNRKEACDRRAKVVLQFSLNGEFIKEYPSGEIASKETGIKRDTIRHNCSKQTRTTHGYIFKYKEDCL